MSYTKEHQQSYVEFLKSSNEKSLKMIDSFIKERENAQSLLDFIGYPEFDGSPQSLMIKIKINFGDLERINNELKYLQSFDELTEYQKIRIPHLLRKKIKVLTTISQLHKNIVNMNNKLIQKIENSDVMNDTQSEEVYSPSFLKKIKNIFNESLEFSI